MNHWAIFGIVALAALVVLWWYSRSGSTPASVPPTPKPTPAPSPASVPAYMIMWNGSGSCGNMGVMTTTSGDVQLNGNPTYWTLHPSSINNSRFRLQDSVTGKFLGVPNYQTQARVGLYGADYNAYTWWSYDTSSQQLSLNVDPAFTSPSNGWLVLNNNSGSCYNGNPLNLYGANSGNPANYWQFNLVSLPSPISA